MTAPHINGAHAPHPGSEEFKRAREEFEKATSATDDYSLHPIDWPTLQGEPPPRRWLIQDWLGYWPTLVSGGGGAGKSRLMQAVCTSLTTQFPYIGSVARDLRTLTWSCEDDRAEIWRNQLAINKYFGVDMDDISGRLHIVPRLGEDNTLMGVAFGQPSLTKLYFDLEQQVNDLRIDVLVLDNIAQVFGGNENDRHHVTVFVNALVGLVRDRPFAPILLGHVSRKDGSEFSGSAAWENAVRMRWYLGSTLPDEKPDDDDGDVVSDIVYLCRRKANYAPKDYRRMRFESGILIPEQSLNGQGFDRAFRDEAAEDGVLAGLRKLLALKLDASGGASSPNYLPKQLIKRKLAGGYTLKELEAATNRLLIRGRIENREVGRYGNRTPKMGLVIVEQGAQASCSSPAQTPLKPAHSNTPPPTEGGVFEH